MAVLTTRRGETERDVQIPPVGLEGRLALPEGTPAVVAFAHGSGSSRLSPRNQRVAEALREHGLGTLLFDLLTDEEATDRGKVFDIPLLAERLILATRWLGEREETRGLRVGYFGASTGAAAALVAAARGEREIGAIVSRGGRPDLAGSVLPQVRAPTLLVVGGQDPSVLELNRAALAELRCEKELAVVPGATHLFEEPGALEEVMALAGRWFSEHLAPEGTELIFRDREQAGRRLAEALVRFKGSDPVVLALPRGGVPVAFEIARSLEAPLDLVLVRKIGAPFQPELAVAAVVDGEKMEITVNEDLVEALGLPEGYLREQAARQVEEIERRRGLYLRGRDRVGVEGKTAVIVDDGIATGATMRAALRAVRRRKPARLVLAVPVAPPDTVAALRREADEVVCLSTPSYFGAIGQFYADFRQVGDDEVRELLERAAGWRPKPAAPGVA